MKFSTFIIIALLSLIAYALLRPAPSPNAMQEFVRVAQQLIPLVRPGGPDSRPATEQPTPASNSGGQGNPPATQAPSAPPKTETPGNGRGSLGQPELNWDPLSKGGDDALRKQYTGSVREHLNGDCLLIRAGTRAKPDSGPEGEYVLTGYPGAADVSLNTQIDFYAYAGGVVPYENDTETKTVLILVYISAIDSKNPESPQNTPPAGNTQSARPGSWMWQGNSPLDRGPYKQK